MRKILVILLVFFIATACKTFFIPSDEGLSTKSDLLFDNILQNELRFKNLNIRFAGEIISGESTGTFRGNLRIKKDSIIWISVRSFNIEGARIVITQDSLKIINRMNNTFFIEDISALSKRFNIEFDYNIIQSLIINSFFFYPPIENDDINSYNICSDSILYCINRIIQRDYVKLYDETDNYEKNDNPDIEIDEFILQKIKIYPIIYRIAEVYLENNTRRQSLNIKYNKMFKVDEQYFPKEIIVDLNSIRTSFKLNISINNINLNKESDNYPFSISSNYEAIN